MRKTMILAAVLGLCHGGKVVGEQGMEKAGARWAAVSETYQAGEALQTAVVIQLGPGWHTYWENPGDTGMPLKVTWNLPPGWQCDGLMFPAPGRFVAAGLTSYGYKGTLVLPVMVHAPQGAEGRVVLEGKISWLVCNEESCLPGAADLKLALTDGPPQKTESAEMIDASLLSIPQAADDKLVFSASEENGEVRLEVRAEDDTQFLPNEYELFPATPQIVGDVSKVVWSIAEKEAVWMTKVKKSEYFASPLRELSVVFVGKNGQSAVRLSWKNL